MASVNDYLIQLQKLTQTNLSILSAISKAITTKQDHLQVNVDGTPYVIPSYIALENKINALQENFENLVHIHESGEAFINLDGNSRVLELRGYTHTPNSLSLNPVSEFGVEQNDIFKDFITPLTYINIPLTSLPNDITQVVVKKVIPQSSELINILTPYLQTTDAEGNVQKKISSQINYGDLYKILSAYKEDVDYVAYDKIYRLPIRKNIGSATYVIEQIVSDVVDENLDNYITLKLSSTVQGYTNSLTYKLFDDTISKALQVGDKLVTYDDTAKMEITEIRSNTNTIVVKVLNGEYLNLVPYSGTGTVQDLSKIRFYSPIDFDNDKYIKIPLEEDNLIFVAVAGLNDRMNVQASWGNGLLMYAHDLVYGDQTYGEYYKTNVRNVGDILYEVTQVMSNTITQFSGDTFQTLTQAKPVINTDNLVVTQINKHLNNSTTVQNIRALYSQKKQYSTDLDEIQTKINEINKQLATISFDDTSDLRTIYTSQLSSYNAKKNELVTAITKTIDSIAQAANDSEVPIEAAKYRIRGYFDWKSFATNLPNAYGHICGIRVQYRYKNIDQEQGNAQSINSSFVFSDWVDMKGFDEPRVAAYDGGYKFEPEYTDYDTDNLNVPSFNQIDIPISQGETVDIRLRVLYDYGLPFVEMKTEWSDIVNIAFPEEYLKDVQITTIIEENNNDIETNRFQNIIQEQGIPDHINDKIIDQDITYFHRPESIASGFYTQERRVIPLKDKLSSLDAMVTALQDEILGTAAEAISVSLVNGDVSNQLYPFQENLITVTSYDQFLNEDTLADAISDGSYTYDATSKVVSTILNVVLTNNSDRTVKIFSLFPGDRSSLINDLTNHKYELGDYCYTQDEDKGGVWIKYGEGTDKSVLKLQGANQFMYFRIKDVYTSADFYKKGDQFSSNYLSLDADYTILSTPSQAQSGIKASLYPVVREEYALCLDSDNTSAYLTLAPGAEVIVPMVFEYIVEGAGNFISKTCSIDIRTSLYNDPSNYTFKVTAKNESTVQDKLLTTNRKNLSMRVSDKAQRVKYKTTVVK